MRRRRNERVHRFGLEHLEARYVLDSSVVINDIMYNSNDADELLEFV